MKQKETAGYFWGTVFKGVIVGLGDICKDFAKGFASIPFTPVSNKPKWCKCAKCGAFHHLAP
jgi:hypothetical protein